MKEQFTAEHFNYDGLDLIAQDLPNIISNKAEEIPIESILEKICVSQPYFAFRKIYKYENFLIAPITREQQLGNEIAQMPMGEVCRHMAILGTCAAALDQKEKYYYLAREGRAKTTGLNLTAKIDLDANRPLYAIMRCDDLERRSANSSGVLVKWESEIMAGVEVGYEKIPDKLFKKFFNDHFQPTKTPSENPYTGIINFENVKIVSDQLTATMPQISTEHCAGHFYGCPAIPIAFAAYNVTRYAGELLFSKTGIKNYFISKADLISSHLPFPSDKNDVKITYNGLENGEHKFLCLTEQNGKEVSSLELSMTTMQ